MSQAARPPEVGEFGLASWLQAAWHNTTHGYTVVPPAQQKAFSSCANIGQNIHMYRRDTLVVHCGYETITRVVVRDGDMTRKERDDD